MDEELKQMKAALQLIADWKIPESSGRYWDTEKTKPMSYSAAFGSNGERDYVRMIARRALGGAKP